MSAHVEGRIGFIESGDANKYTLIDNRERWLMSILHNGEALVDRQRENLRRLVACWNACEGISTDVLEMGRMSPDAFQVEESRADRAESQRDELLEALVDLVAFYPPDSEDAVVTAARAAIAKATGELP